MQAQNAYEREHAMLCRIGDVEIWRILEINAPFLKPEDLYPTAGPDLHDVFKTHAPGQVCATSGLLILPIQGFLLKTPTHNILVDSCVGNDKTVPRLPDWHQRSDNRFMAALTAAGVGPKDIDFVLCTHLHTDHVGWNTQKLDGRWVPTFPNAKYLMPSEDEATYREQDTDTYRESVLPVIENGQAELVTAGHMLGDYVSLIPSPGHTPGHVSVLIKSGGAEALITGDALHSTAQCCKPEWLFCSTWTPNRPSNPAVPCWKMHPNPVVGCWAATSPCPQLGVSNPMAMHSSGRVIKARWENGWHTATHVLRTVSP